MDTITIPAAVEILNTEHWEETARFASETKQTESLRGCLDQLHRIASNMRAQCRVTKDWAPYSFNFVITRDGKCLFNGGVIYPIPANVSRLMSRAARHVDRALTTLEKNQ